MLFTLGCLLILLTGLSDLKAQVLFYKVIGNAGEDIAHCVRQTPDRGYVIAGVTSSADDAGSNVYLLKTDSLGLLEWSSNFGSPISTDVAKKLVVLEDGGFAVVGYTNSGNSSGYDVLVIRTDQFGNEIWQQTFGGSEWDFGHDIIILPNGNFGIAGTTYSNGDSDGYFLEIGPDGSQVGSFTFGENGSEEAFNSLASYNGFLYFCGTASQEIGTNDGYILKSDMVGNEIWSRTFGGENDDYLSHIIATSDGNLLAVGAISSTPTAHWDYYYVKTNTSGDLIFAYNDGGLADEVAREVAEDVNGNYALIGYTTTHGAGGRSMQLFQISSGGFWMNSPHSHSPLDEEGHSISSTHDGGFVAAGYTRGYQVDGADVFIVKTNLGGSAGFDSDVTAEIDETVVSVHDPVKVDVPLSIQILATELRLTSSEMHHIKRVMLSDVSGRLLVISRISGSANEASVSLTALAKGIYIVMVETIHGLVSRKVVITR